MYKQLLIIFFSFFLIASCDDNKKVESIVNNDNSSHGKKVVAYVNSWQDNWGENNEKVNQITHINYAFANIKDGKVIEGNENDGEVLRKLNNLKQVNKDLKILISVGGWSWSKNFSDAVLTQESRQTFANSAIDFMLKHKIDGIDLDWEYPGQRGDNNKFRPEDKENFTAILKLIREKLEVLSSDDNKYLLTIATGADPKYLEHTNMREAHQYLDFINIMTYDFFTGGSSQTGHHSNLFQSEFNNTSRVNAADAVEVHFEAGIPIEKIVLGVPFYGRYWTKTNPENNGLYQKSTGDKGSYDYKSISENIKNKIFVPYWDEKAKAPYIWREADSLFLTYENSKSLKFKIDFVKSRKMGGIMFWQFNGDNGELLNTISNNLNN
jgi:chitinase